jgi:exodeoxyribonuclease VII small subunit
LTLFGLWGNVPDSFVILLFNSLAQTEAGRHTVAAKKSKKSTNFETAIEELETLVEEMEQGEISLEESLKKFERGIELTRTCQKALQEAEQKVQMLVETKNGDQLVDAPDADQPEQES